MQELTREEIFKNMNKTANEYGERYIMQELTREEIFKNMNKTANEYGVSLVTNFKLMNLPEDPILSKTDNDFLTGLFIFYLLLSIFMMSSWWIVFLILVILQIWSGKIKEKLLKTYA